MKTNTFDEKLSAALDIIAVNPRVSNDARDAYLFKEAKAAIINLVLNDVIGEDEDVINIVQRYANNLRAEQRAIVTNGKET